MVSAKSPLRRGAIALSTVFVVALLVAAVALVLKRRPSDSVLPPNLENNQTDTSSHAPATMPRRVFRIQRDWHDDQQPGQSQPRHADMASASVDPEAEKEKRERAFAESIRSHRQEHKDSAWSGEFEGAIGRSLSTLSSAHGFSTTAIDCRTESCVATIEWPTYADAMLQWKAVLLGTSDVPCARMLLLPDDPSGADDSARRYSHDVLFTRCARTAAAPM